MRTKIDKVITRISGSSDYMGDMSKITGNIKTIDRPYYIDQLKKIISVHGVITNEFKQHFDKSNELKEMTKLFDVEFNNLDMANPYKKIVNKNSGKTKHKIRLTPTDIYNSKWFEYLKRFETNATTIINQFEIDGVTIKEKQQDIINKNPDTVNAFKFYGLTIDDPTVYKTVWICKTYANKIIEIILSPMYDAKKFIVNHWLPQIDEILSSKFEDQKNATRSDIQNFVYTFVLAKYRLSLTSNSEEFTKILLQSMSENNIADMDAARFCNIIDGINLDALDKKENVYKFAEATKTEIQKIMNGEKVNPTEILKDIEQILNTGAEDEAETSDVEDIF